METGNGEPQEMMNVYSGPFSEGGPALAAPELMGIHGEEISGDIYVVNFNFGDKPSQISQTTCPFPLPISADKWPDFWKHGEWNEFRARITGNPPTITTWINGVKFMKWTDSEKRHPDTGAIAFQIHGGGDYTKQFVRYRKVRVKELD